VSALALDLICDALRNFSEAVRLHRVVAAALRAGTQVTCIAEHIAQRDQGVDLRCAASHLSAGDAAAPAGDVAGDGADIAGIDKLLARKFKTMEALEQATAEQLVEVDGIGDVMAASIVSYFKNDDNRQLVERLKGYGLQMSLSDEQLSAQSDRLAGYSIVISGVFQHHSRDEYKALIEQHGGKNVGSISKKTSFILAGDNMGPSKLEKAQKLGIPIKSEDDFLQMIAAE
jgi:hypothetical protein